MEKTSGHDHSPFLIYTGIPCGGWKCWLLVLGLENGQARLEKWVGPRKEMGILNAEGGN